MPTSPTQHPLNLFYSYAHADEKLHIKLTKHLSNLQHQGYIAPWHDRDISAGQEWEHEIDKHLEEAHIILLLISKEFMASRYCYSIEMQQALQRHNAHEAVVIPIILSDVDWKGAPFERLQALPKDSKPVTSRRHWQSHDEAFTNIAQGIRLAIETHCGLAGYLTLYQSQPQKLLSRRGSLKPDYPDSVAKTWNLSFEKVQQLNPAAADLLRLCAFLAPDAIPETLITDGASQLGKVLKPVANDPFQFNEALEVLGRYSLLRRTPATHTLSMHRLVQTVLKDSMNPKTQRQWAARTVKAVDEAFPDVDDVQAWPHCDRALPHALACPQLIADYALTEPRAAFLLNRTASYLNKHARYAEAEPLLQRALAICEQLLGAEHPDTASSLNNLAALYNDQGKYEQAEPLLQRALAICEQMLGPDHPNTVGSLNNLAFLCHAQGKYELAEPLLQRALAIWEQVLGPDHPNTAGSLNNLAALYDTQGKYEQAEPLYQRALAICEQMLGAQHPDTAGSLNNLAALYHAQGKYEQAEPLYQRALAIREQVLGPEHPNTAISLNNLAGLYYAQGKYELAEPLLQRALAIREQMLGAQHPDTVTVRENYAILLGAMERKGN